jgi:excisionase family DNA binding protein
MSIKEVKALLGVDQQTLYEMVWKGQIPSTRIAGRVKFDPRSLATWLEANSSGN